MIKVTLGEQPKEKEESFPLIKTFTYPTGTIIYLLINEEKKGTILNIVNNSNVVCGDKIGNVWDISDVENELITSNLSITLQND